MKYRPIAFRKVVARRGMLFCVIALLVGGCASKEEKAQAYYEKGMALIAQKDDLAARTELLSAVKYDQNKVEVWRALAGIDERTGATSLFLDFRRVVELDPKDQVTRLRLARMMFDGRAIDLALKTIDATPQDQEWSAGLHALRALILSRLNDANGAVREAQKASGLDSNNVDAAIILAADKASKGQNDEALAILNKLPANGQADMQVRLIRLQILGRKGDLQGAEALLKDLVKDNPQRVDFQNQLVQFYVAQRRLDDAEVMLRQMVSANSADSKLGLELVRFLGAAKGADAARAELDRRVKEGGDVFAYRLALAEMDFAQGKTQDSAKAVEGLIAAANSKDRKIEAQVKLAEILIASKNIAGAEPVLNDVIQADRRNTRALALRASLLIDKGKIDDAIADLREALNDQPKNPQLLLLMATAYERNNQPELADRQYSDALKATDLNTVVLQQYVAFLRRRDNLSRAEDVLVEASARYPRSVEILRATLAQIRMFRQNYAGALEMADRIAKTGDNRGIADQIRGAAFGAQNKPDESIAALEQAQAASPDALQPVVPLVSAYLRANKGDKAEALLQSLLAKNPTSAELLVLLGQAQSLNKKPDEAIKSFRTAIARQPKNPAAYGALSELYFGQKKYDDAYEVLQAALKEQPDNFSFRLTAAAILDTKGDHEAAMSLYDAMLKEQPGSLVLINNLASLLLDYRTDQPSRERAFKLSDALKGAKIPQYLDTLGWAQFQRGDYKASIATLEQAKVQLPQLAAIRYHLGMAYRADGQAQRADEELAKAAELEPVGTVLRVKIDSAVAGRG